MVGILAAASLRAMTGLELGWPLNSTTRLHLSWMNTPTLLTAVDAELLLLRMTDCQPSFWAMDCSTWPWPIVQSRPCWPPVPMHTLKFFAETAAPVDPELLLLELLPPELLPHPASAIAIIAAAAPNIL